MFDRQFPEAERRIFTVSVAGGTLHFDPVRVRRLLLAVTQGELNLHLDEIDTCAKQYAQQMASDGKVQPAVIAKRAALEGRMADAAFQAFGLSPVNPETGSGYTEAEVLSLLNAFIDFEQKKSPNTGTTPTSSPPTGSRRDTE